MAIPGNQFFSKKRIQKLKADKYFMTESFELCTHYKHYMYKIIFSNGNGNVFNATNTFIGKVTH